MKYFIVAILLFVFIIAGVLTDSIYINKITNEMLNLANSLPKDKETLEASFESAKEKIDKIIKLWDSSNILLNSSINFENYEFTYDNLICMQDYLDNMDYGEFFASKRRFEDGVKTIRKIVSLSFENLL